MKFNQEIRYTSHPKHVMRYSNKEIREEFLKEGIMKEDAVCMVYSHYDRMIIGGASPVNERLKIGPMDIQKTESLTDRRELGIINTGGDGKVMIDKKEYELKYKDALYIGKGKKNIELVSMDPGHPAKFYMNSALAWVIFPDKIVKKYEANPVHLGDQKNANIRVLNQYIVPGIVESNQLMMGITEVKEGNVWNTMPCHLHELRMEAYYYFEIPEKQSVCHIMGQPDETRNIWVNNDEVVISPPWSVHTAAGTSNYCFIWGMAGSDSEMDAVKTTEMK